MTLDTAIGVSARIWCDPDYQHIIMNPELAQIIALLLVQEANRQELNKEKQNGSQQRS